MGITNIKIIKLPSQKGEWFVEKLSEPLLCVSLKELTSLKRANFLISELAF
jgi:hypothetical protein